MAEAFLGKWRVDLSSVTGLDEFAAAFEFPKDRLEMFRNLSYTLELSARGDGSYSGVVTYASDAVPVQSYSFLLGNTFVFSALDGTTPDLTITVEGGRFVESYKLGDKEWQTVREVDGNVMTSTTTFGGVSAVQTLHKE